MHTDLGPSPHSEERTLFRTREQIAHDCRAAGMVPTRWRCTACGYRLRRWAPPELVLDAPRCEGFRVPHVALVMRDMDALEAWAADPSQDDHNPYA